MVSELSSLGASVGYRQIERAAAPSAEAAAGNSMKDAAQRFTEVFDKADAAVAGLARGEGSAQAVVEAMAQAELALQAAVTVRDRVVEAYQEILRMPV
jgi:flagellar hook-basal body complex protein FliE